MIDYDGIASGLRAGTVSADEFTTWLVKRSAFWFVLEGDSDASGALNNARPLVVSHPSGATVALVFTERSRAEHYRQGRAELASAQIGSARPSSAINTLLLLPIDGVVFNAGDPTRLNAGRRQIEELRALVGPEPGNGEAE